MKAKCTQNINKKTSKGISMHYCCDKSCSLYKLQTGKVKGCRFSLECINNKNKKILWILMNCSTAEVSIDNFDQTIKNVHKISTNLNSDWAVINISPIRAASSYDFKNKIVPNLGPELLNAHIEANTITLQKTLKSFKPSVVCLAFGASSGITKNPKSIWAKYMKDSLAQIIKTIKNYETKNQIEWKCINTIKDGHPRHPGQQSLSQYMPINKIKLKSFDIENYLTKFQLL